MAIQQKITPFLWFDSNAEEAVGFYTSIFKDSRRPGDSGHAQDEEDRHPAAEGRLRRPLGCISAFAP